MLCRMSMFFVLFMCACMPSTQKNGQIVDANSMVGGAEAQAVPVDIGTDSDNDGLGDAAEGIVGTNPNNPDTDGDGLMDGAEFSAGSNPLEVDSDSDGTSDGDEVSSGTDPISKDSDGDGFDDDVEIAANTDPKNAQSWPFDGEVWPDGRRLAQAIYGEGWDLGNTMANLDLSDQRGNALELYQFYGSVILLDFSAGWCAPCRKTAETAQAMWKRNRDKGLMIIHLLTEGNQPGDEPDAPLLTQWADQYNITFPVALQADAGAYKAFQKSGAYSGSLPFLVLLDRNMRIDSTYGLKQEDAIEARIEQLLEQEPPVRAYQGGPGPGANENICDQDGDGVKNTSCGGLDCADKDKSRHPDAAEMCDETDRNCDGLIHDGATDSISIYLDADSDGYGDPEKALLACQAFWPYVPNGDDCDDSDETANPMTPWYRDADSDGSGTSEESVMACLRPDGFVDNDQDADDTMASSGCWSDVSVGRDHACGLRKDGKIRCWGSDTLNLLDAPTESGFVSISAGYRHTCALKDDGSARCWGAGGRTVTTPPDTPLKTLACGLNVCCGLTTAMEGDNIVCWGSDQDGVTTVPTGRFKQVSVGGGRHACAIDGDDQIQCWGNLDGFRGAPSPTPTTPGAYAFVNAGHYLTCAITMNGEARCWGSNSQGQDIPPADRYTSIKVGTVHSCGLNRAGEVLCFGSDSFSRTASPEGEYKRLAVNQLHSCALGADDLITCWGHAEDARLAVASCVD